MFTVSKSPSNISVEYLTFTEVTKWLSVYILSADFEIDMIKVAKGRGKKQKWNKSTLTFNISFY